MKGKTVLKVALALLLCPLAMYLFSLTLPRRFTASMGLLVDQGIRGQTSERPDAGVRELTEFSRARSLATTLDLMTSSKVLLEAVRRTADKYPKAFPDQEKVGERYASLASKLRVDNNRESDIIQLRVTMDDPEIAAETANQIGYSFLDETMKMAKEGGDAGSTVASEKIATIEKRLAKVDGDIRALKISSGMSNPVTESQIAASSIKEMEFQIARVEAEYNGAMGELAVAEQTLRSTPQYLQSSSTADYNPAIAAIENEISRGEAELASLRNTYTDNHPNVKRAQTAVENLKQRRASLSKTVEGTVQRSLNPNYTAAVQAAANARSRVTSLGGNLGNLRGSLASKKGQSRSYPQVDEQLGKLTREKMNLETNYQIWVQRLDSIEATGTGRVMHAKIVSPAYAPTNPSFPNTRLFVLMGLAVGIVISALIIMPKAPEIVYAPTPADTLALDPALRAELMSDAERVTRPAIERGGAS